VCLRQALRAKLADGGVISYTLSSDIESLADWADVATWYRIDKDGFNRKFKLIVADQKGQSCGF
jgi:hypothetical protein